MSKEELQAKLNDPQVESRLAAVNEFSRLDEFPTGLFVQALGDDDWRVRKEAVTWFLQLPDARSHTAIVLQQLRHPDNAGLRNAAIEILISLGSRALPALTHELTVADAEVRKFIVDILGEIGDSNCATNLLPLLQDDDENVCYAAAETLGKLRATEAVGPLLELLESGDAGLRFTVFEALSAIGAGVPAVRILHYCEDRLLRKAVFNCLGQIADPQGLPALLDGLSDPLRRVREAAVMALGTLLGNLDDQVVEEALQGRSLELKPQLGELLHHQDQTMRAAACQVLSLVADADALEQLLPLLADESLRPQVVAACKRFPSELLTRQFDAELSEEKAVFLIYLAGELQLSAVAPLAQRMLDAENPQLRYSAVLTLGKIAHLPSAGLLSTALSDAIPDIRTAAAESLKRLGDIDAEAVVVAVSPFLEAPTDDLRLLAVRILGGLTSEQVEDALLMALKDVSSQVRCEALRGLNGGSSARLLSGLTLALTDEAADVRRLAAEAMAAFPAAKVNSILTHALDDADPWVRMAAIRSIQSGGPQELEKIIARGLADDVGLVVIAALEAAVRLLPETAEAKLIAALEQDDEEVIRTAVRLLVAGGAGAQALNHDRPSVRLLAVEEIIQDAPVGTNALLEKRASEETEPTVRQAIERALRRSSGA